MSEYFSCVNKVLKDCGSDNEDLMELMQKAKDDLAKYECKKYVWLVYIVCDDVNIFLTLHWFSLCSTIS